MPSFRELLNATKAEIREVDTAAADEARQVPGTVVLDVREADEHEQGAIPGSLFIPRGTLETGIESRVPDKSTPLVVICAGGTRSAFAAKTLAELGYTDVVSVAGGFNKWKDEGRDWAAPRSLTPEQRNRYKRHLLLPEVDVDGQLKLLDAKVLLLGAGGLGSPAALYLAAAGVGTIGIIDMDVVDESNLQRQILHNMDRIGDRKVDSAKKTLTALNPDVNVVTYDVRLGADNVLDILGEGWDVIVDGTDNFPTRFLVNDASVKLGIPVVHGSIFRFEGMVTVFDPKQRPHLPRHGPRAAAGRAGPQLRRGRRARRAARHRRVASRPSRPSSCCWAWAIRSSAGCSPTTPSSRASASTRCGSTPPTRSPTPTATASSSPSWTATACRTRSHPRPPAERFAPRSVGRPWPPSSPSSRSGCSGRSCTDTGRDSGLGALSALGTLVAAYVLVQRRWWSPPPSCRAWAGTSPPAWPPRPGSPSSSRWPSPSPPRSTARRGAARTSRLPGGRSSGSVPRTWRSSPPAALGTGRPRRTR